MQTQKRSKGGASPVIVDADTVEVQSAVVGETGIERLPNTPAVRTGRVPARLPEHSQAAVAQRFQDVPERPTSGFMYSASHLRLHPPGWHTRRHGKRKNLRQTIGRMVATERTSSNVLMHMVLGTISLFLVVAIVFVTVLGFVQATQQRFSKDVVTLEDILPKDSLRAYDESGQQIYLATDQSMQVSVPFEQISRNIVNAEVAIEDQNFWKNAGFDITGIVRAAISDLTRGHVVSGGSTITQQLIKNVIIANRDQTIMRKLQELILAPDVTRYYTKEKILDMYLNTSYYGEQAYGVEAAAFTYFNLQSTPQKSAASQLDIAQAAMLAGIPSAPTARDPLLHPQAAQTRMHEVLQQMYVQGYITASERSRAISEAAKPDFFHRGIVNNRLAPHFIRYALQELAQELHVKQEDLSRSGLVVSTTLDLALQNQVLKIAQQHIGELAQAHHMSNAAVTIIDQHTGAIHAIVGNINPDSPTDGDFDVASQGFRQPGSSFKPFIYATAFGQHISPGETVDDSPLTVPMCCGLPSYSPNNYDLKYHGLITYRYALQNSFNIPAVKLLMRTGVDEALQTAQRMGIGDYQGTPNYTMVLGTLSVHLLDETSAYGAFANNGVRVGKHTIDTVKDTQGRVILHVAPKGEQVISPQVAFMTTDVLSDNNSRTFEFGKCSSLYLYSNSQQQCYAGNPGTVRPAAAKTGTSTDFRDNWTMGYTTDFVVGVWCGNNDNSAMVNITGVDGAGPIWHDTMQLLEKGRPIQNFANPGGVVQKAVNYPGKTTTDWYLP